MWAAPGILGEKKDVQGGRISMLMAGVKIYITLLLSKSRHQSTKRFH